MVTQSSLLHCDLIQLKEISMKTLQRSFLQTLTSFRLWFGLRDRPSDGWLLPAHVNINP